jgi:hypothetical protein
MEFVNKAAVKDLLAELPLAPELYWQLLSPGRPLNESFNLDQVLKRIPEWRQDLENCLKSNEQPAGKRVLIFATLRYWIAHAAVTAMALRGLGHAVRLSYLPYSDWTTPTGRFDIRRQNAYAQDVLGKLKPYIQVSSLIHNRKLPELSSEYLGAVQDNAWRDTQYTLQVEEVDPESELYHLRLERNRLAARSALELMQSTRPQVVVIPNGSILEFGAVHQAARQLGLQVVTYEFGEQHQRIWIGQDREVMRQETDELWAARKELPLAPEQLEQVQTLFASRQRASLWENFSRRWQGVPSQGGETVRQTLGLDDRPVILLATNVIGDSLTLGRQVFSDSMTGWLERTVKYFEGRTGVQFVVRIHPGELITKGPSVADVVRNVLPNLPEHIHLLPADAPINTYDIIEIAQLGLVYTTTVGMEMAMSGLPVIVVGKTHYREKGFTLDPDSWEAYFALLQQVLDAPEDYRLAESQVELAWNYAYRFFFEYPKPFPWHLLHIWDDLQEWPLRRVLGQEGQAHFGDTFRYLVGEPVKWS